MTFVLGNAPLPITDVISRPRRRDKFKPDQDDPQEGLISDAWMDYMSRLAQTVGAGSTRIGGVSLEDQSLGILATDISGGALRKGLYRITYHARITRAAGTSSSLDVTISWTDGGVAQSQTAASITGNTTATVQSVSYLIHIDSASPIRYATTYGSVGAPTMQYRLDVVLEVSPA